MKVLLAGFLLVIFFPTFAFAQNSPFIQAVPVSVANGSTTTIYGKGFCSSPNCSSVTLKQGNNLIASDVIVSGDGTFNKAFVVNVAFEQTISASQKADGSVLEATTGINIVPADNFNNSPISSPNPKNIKASPLKTPQESSLEVSPNPTNEALRDINNNSEADPALVKEWLVPGLILLAIALLLALFMIRFFRKNKKYKK